MQPEIVIEQEDPRREDIAALIKALNAYDEGLYPPEANYHLSAEALYSPDIIFLVARQGGEAVAMIGLWLRWDWQLGEVKRMFVSPKVRGQGLAGRMLARVEQLARDHKISQLMLETGPLSTEALKVYQRAGFTRRGPFADYPEAPFSVFMEKTLTS